MKISPAGLPGVWVVDLVPHVDARGLFARTFCRQEFEAAGLDPCVAQCSLAYNHRAGTLRGMHWAGEPVRETKLVRVTRGALLDVVVDIRPDSPTYLRHVAVELSADNRRALFISAGLAHGYQTLVDGTEAFYQMNVPFEPGHDQGVRFDDPVLGIDWPLPVTMISDKDQAWPLLPGSESASPAPGTSTGTSTGAGPGTDAGVGETAGSAAALAMPGL